MFVYIYSLIKVVCTVYTTENAKKCIHVFKKGKLY